MRLAGLCTALLLACACGGPPRESARFVPPPAATTAPPTPIWRPVTAPAAEVFALATALLAAQGLTPTHSDDGIGLIEALTPGGVPFTVLVTATTAGARLSVSSAESAAVAAFWRDWEHRAGAAGITAP